MGQIPRSIECISSVYSSCTPSCRLFFFSNFHTFSFFHLLLQQLPHSATMFPYACMGLLTIHMCAVSIIIFFICCQCSFTSRYFHSVSTTLSLTMLWYSSRLFLLELPYIHSWFKLETLYYRKDCFSVALFFVQLALIIYLHVILMFQLFTVSLL